MTLLIGIRGEEESVERKTLKIQMKEELKGITNGVRFKGSRRASQDI